MGKREADDLGNGFLARRLERVYDLVLRRRVGMRDWAMGIIVVGIAQITDVNAIEWWAFVTLLVIALSVITVWLFVFPRLEPRVALKLEEAMIALSSFTIAFLVAVSGGATSPYVFFFALTMIFVAAFVETGRAREIQLTIASACAVAPILYDWDAARANDFIPLIVIALIVWWATSGLVAVKRLSMVAAELEARRLAYVDQLTGVANLRGVEQYAEDLNEQGSRFAVVSVNIDGVGEINRTFGHFAGDEAMRRAAGAMRVASIELDQVSRLGGGEFAVLLPGGDEAEADRWRARFRERLEIANAMAPDGSRVAADVGIAAGAAGEDFNETLALAAEERETLVASPHAGGTQASPAERAERLREQMSERATDGRRASFESVELPTGAPLAVMAAAAIGLAIGLTGGASSMLISVPILGVTYFAVFGTRIETIFATVVTLLASIGAVLANTPISTADQTRSLTVLITVAIAAYTLQSNSRRLMIAERRAAELSLVDALTGLPNRTAFERDLARALPRSGADEHSREVRLDGRPAVAALDLAGFGAIHSRLGHARADLLLAEVAHALRDALGTEGEIYRIGPDEYAAIIRAHHMQHVANVGARCADAVHALDSDDRYADQGVVVEFRFGGAIWEPGMTAADLAAAAIAEQSQFAGAGAAPLVTSAG